MNYVPFPRSPNAPGVVSLSRDKQGDTEKGKQIRIVVLSTIAFAVLSHMVTFRALESINVAFTSAHFNIVTDTGETTLRGTMMMTGLFFGIMIYLMTT